MRPETPAGTNEDCVQHPGVTLAMVLNRWPETLAEALRALAPFVSKMVAVVDQSSGCPASGSSSDFFDAVEYARDTTLDQLRNQSLRLAREVADGPWVLIMDSDEFMHPESVIALRDALAKATETCAFLLPRFNYIGHGRWATTYSFRLFRLDRPIAYRYEIHESISPSLIEHGLRWEHTEAAFQHLDFLTPDAGKRARYKHLLQAAILKGVDLAFSMTLYAIECAGSGDHAVAFENLDLAIEAARDSTCSGALNGSDDFPVIIKAQLLLKCGELRQAKPLFERLCDRSEPRAVAGGRLGLAQIEGTLGNQAAALTHIDAALAVWRSADALFSRATAYCALGKPLPALEDLHQGLRLNPMANDPRIQSELPFQAVYEVQCLLHPDYRGSPRLADSLPRRTGALVD